MVTTRTRNSGSVSQQTTDVGGSQHSQDVGCTAASGLRRSRRASSLQPEEQEPAALNSTPSSRKAPSRGSGTAAARRTAAKPSQPAIPEVDEGTRWRAQRQSSRSILLCSHATHGIYGNCLDVFCMCMHVQMRVQRQQRLRRLLRPRRTQLRASQQSSLLP